MPKELVRACDVAMVMGLSSQTVTKRADRGEIPGAVWVGSTLRFDMDKVQEFINTGGQRRKQIHQRGGRQKIRVVSGGRAPMISESSETVEISRIPGVGIDYEHRGMNGRNVTGTHPWRPVTVQ